MFDRNRRIEGQPDAGFEKTIPEFDIFHRRPRIRFVEPAGFKECGPPNRSKSGPKRRSPPLPVLVDVAVHEVPVLRKKSAGARLIVVGSDDCLECVIVPESTQETVKCARIHADIGVNENQEFPGCAADSQISREGRAAAPSCGNDRASECLRNIGRIVGGSVIGHNAFKIRVTARPDVREAPRQVSRTIENRHDNR